MATRVVAIIAAHNEADVIEQVVGDLIAQGVQVYLIDHGSTDGTADRVRALVGRGLIAIEPLDDDGRFRWADILRRKLELAAELDGDWFIHADADELRESPWSGVELGRAFALVDELGYDAVDFAVFNFRPVERGELAAGADLRAAFPFYEAGGAHDRLQVKAWKRTARPVELVSSGGHEARFDGRRVFPIRFILRHYPIRGQAHGERKVFVERRPRFVDEERARGWHVQYDGFEAGARFTWARERLERWNGEHVRVALQLAHRGVGALEEEHARALDAARTERAALERRLADAGGEARRAVTAHEERAAERERELARLRGAAEEFARLRAASDEERARLRGELAAAVADRARIAGECDGAAQRLEALYASRTWRWSSPARLAFEWLARR
jgi:Glycosyl transferase family 2